MQRIVILSLATILFASTGCATLIKGSREDVVIATNPPGAQVYVNEHPVGASPVTVSLRHEDANVRAELAGYQSGHAQITTSFSGWTLLGGLLGIVIDAVTGAITTIDENQLMIQLLPAQNAQQPPAAPPPAATAPPAAPSS